MNFERTLQIFCATLAISTLASAFQIPGINTYGNRAPAITESREDFLNEEADRIEDEVNKILGITLIRRIDNGLDYDVAVNSLPKNSREKVLKLNKNWDAIEAQKLEGK